MLEFIIFYMFVGVTFSILYKQKETEEEKFFNDGRSRFEIWILIPIFWIGYLIMLTYFNDDE